MNPDAISTRNIAVRIGRVVTVAAAARVLYLFLGYIAGTVERFRVESATTLYAILGAIAVALSARSDRDEPHAVQPSTWLTLLTCCFGAVALYWPSIRLGLLSDDFVLADRAARAQFGAVHAELFRPVPIVAWGLLLKSGVGAVGLHVLNITLHALTAFLTVQLASAFVSSRAVAVAAGLLVLTFPSSPEAVTWCAGTFDVTASLFCALTILASRRYDDGPRFADRALLVSSAVVGLLSKETAAVIPLLVLIDAWARRRLTKALILDACTLGAAFGLIGVVRLAYASSLVRRPVTKYVLQRWLFGTGAGVLAPWHIDVFHARPWMPIAMVATILVATILFICTPPGRDHARSASAIAMWPFMATLPTLTFFFVGPDLQGSRYVYLSVIGYAIFIAIIADGARPFGRLRVDIAMLATLIVLGARGTWLQEQPWRAASDVRDAFVDAARDDTRLHMCAAVALANVADSANGAYIFRNGIEHALAQVGVVVVADAPFGCHFRWDDGRGAFEKTD